MSVTWFDGVTITVEVAFATAPLATVPTWTDVSDYVRDIRIDRGRSDEFSQFGPGTASVTFSNRDRRFDPTFAAGPYFGNLLPMKKIRIRATYSAVTYDRYVGFVQGWPQDYEFTFDSTVTVNCVDASRFLAAEELQRSAYEAAVLTDSPAYYWPMQDTPPWVDVQTSATLTPDINPMVADLDRGVPIGATVAYRLDADNIAYVDPTFGTGSYPISALTDGGASGEAVCIEAWVFNPQITDSVLREIIKCKTRDNLNSGFRVSIQGGTYWVEYTNNNDNRSLSDTNTGVQASRETAYHLCVRATTTTIHLYINGVEAWTTSLSVGAVSYSTDPPFLNTSVNYTVGIGSSAVSHIAVYVGTSPTAARVAEHYLAGVTAYGHPYGERSGARISRVLDEIAWPAADRTLGNGDTVHGPYLPERQSAITYMQDVAVAEDGLFFIGRDGKVVLRDRQFQWTRTSSGTFSDDGADLPYEGVTIDANSIEPMRTVVSATYGASNAYLKVEDATNVTAYGPLLEPLSVPTIDAAAQARALANYKLRTTKDPLTRITELRVQPRAKAATAYPVLLGLEIGDRISVERTPGNPVVGSQIVQAVTVQGYSESITVDGVWLTSLYLSPAPDTYIDGPYLLTNDATYGKTGAVAGNKVSF